jgi:hypothetical protein
MPLYELAGTTAGAGDFSPITPVKVVVIGGSVVGIAAASTDAQRAMIFGGQVVGFGGVADQLTLYSAGNTTGQGSLSGYLVRTSSIRGSTVGSGSAFESCPEALMGKGSITAFFTVDRVPCPIACTTLPTTKTFRWGHTFVRGDLMLILRESNGNPFAPIIVLFRMFRVLNGGGLQPVGPFNRRPAVCGKSLGVYYATGTAGELGQPGDWIIEWRWQRSTFSPTHTERYSFRVLDAVLDTSIPDKTCRVQKYGWGD